MPSAVRLLLIMLASFNVWPLAPVLFARSEPAKSMMWNLDDFIYQTPVAFILLLSICVERTACDLELSLFIA